VAWRDAAGRPVVMPRYCPHMGASLALGRVVDGCLQCPFHHWRFDTSGACVEIPGVDRIPKAALQLPYSTVERYGYVWVWYGSREPMFELPDFPAFEADRTQYVGFRFSDATTGTVRQLLENAIDYCHFLRLHGLAMDSLQLRLLGDQEAARDNGPPIAADAWFGAWIEGTMTRWSPLKNPLQWMRSTVATFASGSRFQLLVDGWPGGQRFTAYIDGQEIYKVLMGITPTAERQITQRGWALVKKTNSPWKTLFYFLLFYAQNRGGTMQDIPIYNTTFTGGDDTYVKYDNGLIRFRRYYQSWVDRVDPAVARPIERS
jgi:phenylpropionate dioxygenase-like ring-hydroxylating dioxygenase large terminal subunit